MHRSSNEAEAAERARWLAELALAIDEAQRLAWQLRGDALRGADAQALYGRLESLRSEIDLLRRNGWAAQRVEIEPPWINLPGWDL